MTKSAVSQASNAKAAKPGIATASKAKSKIERSGKIQSLVRATVILEVVAEHREGISLARLSEAVELNNTTAFHLVQTLVELGYLTQDSATKNYHIGSRLFMFAASAVGETTLIKLGAPILEQLSRETGQASHLAIRSNQNVSVIVRMPATGMLQLSDHVVVNRPPHATAIGKVLLAQMDTGNLTQLLDDLSLDRFTEHTLTSKRALQKELALVREQGFALDNGELDLDVRCLAVPIKDFSGRCVAAMGISAPIWRLTDEKLEQLKPIVLQKAAQLSEQMGYQTSE